MSALTIMPEADAVKAQGKHKQKFGSQTKSIVCGDQLCSEVMRDGKTNPQSRFAMYGGGVSQQSALIDSDNDKILDDQDNCPDIMNYYQNDKDVDGIGNKCDNDDPFLSPEELANDVEPIPDGMACDDGNPNTTDVMVEGICVGTQIISDAIPCDDGDPNTTGDVMSGYRCIGNLLADGEFCDDGDPNTTGDVMSGGLCKGWAQNYSTPAIPSILTGLEITDVTLTSIHLIWTASNDPQLANDPIYYALSRSTSTTGPFTNIGYLPGPGFTDTNLSPGTTYYYQVYAYNSIGQSQPSAITATTIVSSTPTNLTATALSTTSLQISWTAAGDIERYTIIRSNPSTGTFSNVGSSLTTSFTDTNLSPGTTYYYQISTSTINGPSEMSDIISGTTLSSGTTLPSKFPWTIAGFYAPVDMNGILNTVKSGQTVPLKFEVFDGPIEKTNTSDIASFTQKQISCSSFTTTITDAIEITNTGGTSLKYDGPSGRFHANWKTPSEDANTCWEVNVTTTNGSNISAYFKLK